MTTGQVGRRTAWRLALGAAIACAVTVGATGSAGARATGTGLDECVRGKTERGEERASAVAACLRETATATTVDSDDRLPDRSTASTDSGTSTGVVVAVGLAGLLVGAGAVLLLKRSSDRVPGSNPATGTTPGGLPTAPVAHAMATPFAAPMTTGTAGAHDRSPSLVAAIVDLADRVPSQALRSEAVAALARAGVQALEPAQGDLFDAGRMRGVGGTPAPDPGWVGRVAATERVGYLDGTNLLRLPEVIVYTAPG